MKSQVSEILPAKVRRSLRQLGENISLSRRKRRLSVASMTERTGIARSTYTRVERGDPTVALGTYAMALFTLGLGEPFGEIADQGGDDQGLLMEAERLPKRIRRRKTDAP